MNALIKKLAAGGFIEEVKSGHDQITKNIKRATHDIKDGQATLEINPELTFNCAYNALLHAGRADVLLPFSAAQRTAAPHRGLVQ